MDESKPKIAMITMCIGAEYQKKWESAARSKEIYCKMHGYAFTLISPDEFVIPPQQNDNVRKD